MREFNPSNKPGTCLWCGRELHMEYNTEWNYKVPIVRKRCPHCNSRRLMQEGGEGNQYWCQDCQKYSDGWKRTVKSRTPRYENVGLGGDGMFDTGLCRADFGLHAARLGFRFQPPAKDGK